jgi:hypothetical protein
MRRRGQSGRAPECFDPGARPSTGEGLSGTEAQCSPNSVPPSVPSVTRYARDSFPSRGSTALWAVAGSRAAGSARGFASWCSHRNGRRGAPLARAEDFGLGCACGAPRDRLSSGDGKRRSSGLRCSDAGAPIRRRRTGVRLDSSPTEPATACRPPPEGNGPCGFTPRRQITLDRTAHAIKALASSGLLPCGATGARLNLV